MKSNKQRRNGHIRFPRELSSFHAKLNKEQESVLDEHRYDHPRAKEHVLKLKSHLIYRVSRIKT